MNLKCIPKSIHLTVEEKIEEDRPNEMFYENKTKQNQTFYPIFVCRIVLIACSRSQQSFKQSLIFLLSVMPFQCIEIKYIWAHAYKRFSNRHIVYFRAEYIEIDYTMKMVYEIIILCVLINFRSEICFFFSSSFFSFLFHSFSLHFLHSFVHKAHYYGCL